MFFMLSIESANRFIRMLTGMNHLTFITPPYSEMGVSAMQELGNIFQVLIYRRCQILRD